MALSGDTMKNIKPFKSSMQSLKELLCICTFVNLHSAAAS